MTVIKIGCDPEGFLWDAGKFISADGLFPGTKEEPHPLDKGAVQVDGLALEFNIIPAETEEEFDKNISTVLAQIDEMVAKVDKKLRLVFRPIAKFDEVWKTIPDTSKVLGCDPDYNVTGQVNPNPSEKLQNTPIRTAAGHVHIGYTEGKERGDDHHFADCCFIAEQFHRSKIFQPKVADEFTRLEYYGNNGAFRPKSYGVELRSPSNLWVPSSETRRATFRASVKQFRDCTGM